MEVLGSELQLHPFAVPWLFLVRPTGWTFDYHYYDSVCGTSKAGGSTEWVAILCVASVCKNTISNDRVRNCRRGGRQVERTTHCAWRRQPPQWRPLLKGQLGEWDPR